MVTDRLHGASDKDISALRGAAASSPSRTRPDSIIIMVSCHRTSSDLHGPGTPLKRMKPRAATADLGVDTSPHEQASPQDVRPQIESGSFVDIKQEPAIPRRGRRGPLVDHILRQYETPHREPSREQTLEHKSSHPALLDPRSMTLEPPELVPSLQLPLVKIPKKLRAVLTETQRGRTSTRGKLVLSNPSPWFRAQQRRDAMFRRRGKMLKPIFLRTMAPQLRKHNGPLIRPDKRHPKAAFRLLSNARAVDRHHRRKRIFNVLANTGGLQVSRLGLALEEDVADALIQCNAVLKTKKVGQHEQPSNRLSRRSSTKANQSRPRVPSPLRVVSSWFKGNGAWYSHHYYRQTRPLNCTNQADTR